jgi:hypothetical protein
MSRNSRSEKGQKVKVKARSLRCAASSTRVDWKNPSELGLQRAIIKYIELNLL